jgi:hypothetical protein
MPGLRSALDRDRAELGSLCHIYQAYTVLPHPGHGGCVAECPPDI